MEIKEGFKIYNSNSEQNATVVEVFKQYIAVFIDESDWEIRFIKKKALEDITHYTITDPNKKEIPPKGTLVYCWDTDEKPSHPVICYSYGEFDEHGCLITFSYNNHNQPTSYWHPTHFEVAKL